MIFSVKNGTFYYRENKPVLHNIDFGIEEGEILSILGANGIGKTTLLKCMLGFIEWKEGDTYFEEQPLKSISHKTFFQKVSYVPQSHNVSFPCSVYETVLLGRSSYLGIFDQPSKKDKDRAYQAIELCGIRHLMNCNINEISGGEQQLCYIARALCSDPSIIILDEAETGLDYANQMIVLSLLKKLSKENKITVIFNTHYPDHALEISDKTLLLLKDGNSLFGATKQIITEENLSNTFGVNIKILENEVNGKIYHSLILADQKE